jgi:hypothetical protein
MYVTFYEGWWKVTPRLHHMAFWNWAKATSRK